MQLYLGQYHNHTLPQRMNERSVLALDGLSSGYLTFELTFSRPFAQHSSEELCLPKGTTASASFRNKDSLVLLFLTCLAALRKLILQLLWAKTSSAGSHLCDWGSQEANSLTRLRQENTELYKTTLLTDPLSRCFSVGVTSYTETSIASAGGAGVTLHLQAYKCIKGLSYRYLELYEGRVYHRLNALELFLLFI